MPGTPRLQTVAASAIALVLAGVLPGWALEPPTKEQLARYRLDGSFPARVARARSYGNHKIPPRAQERLRAKLARLGAGPAARLARPSSAAVLAPPSAWEGMPTTGSVRILALLISFSDYPGETEPAAFESRLFGAGSGSPPFDSLRNFYLRSSYDQLSITGTVLGWYQTSYARSTLSETNAGRQNLIKEALNFYESQGHDFSQYDNDGDGTIDYCCVFWSGPHGEWADFWWGYYTWFSDTAYRLDGKQLTNYSWQWELYDYPLGAFSPSTIIHETGHALGVPDYYDYDDAVGPRGGVGNLDIMDGTGDHNCFSKFMLDWITPAVVPSGSRTVTLRASGLYPDAALFMPGAVDGRIFDEYFMVQNRARSGNDTGLFTGSDGLLVWHIDARLNVWGSDFVYDNSYTAHKLLRLMEADGLEEIETSGGTADAGDYYRAGMTFGPFSSPSSARYDGSSTAMSLSAITGATTPMSATISSDEAPPAVAITNLVAGETVYGALFVEAEASDDNAVARVDLYLDSYLGWSLAAPPYEFTIDTTMFGNGTHTIRAVAYDAAGFSSQAAVDIVTDNIFAPFNLRAVRTVNRSLLLREYVNVLTWTDDARNTSLASYRIYRITGSGRVLVADVPAAAGASYRYLHRGISGAEVYAYEVAGVNGTGREGVAAAVTATR
jgi:M6 family metalloprotease-like protein